MANRFFPVKEPRAGMPFSFKGLARGIRKMANALARLEVVGGHVEWNAFDEPKIIIDPASTMEPSTGGGGSGGGLPDGTEIWGRIEYDETYHRFLQYKERWDATNQKFVEFNEEGVSPKNITFFVSHDDVHGAEDES